MNEKLASSDDLTGKLQDELVETRGLLNTAQQQFKETIEREKSSNAELQRCRQMIVELEEKLELESSSLEDISSKLEESVSQRAALEEENQKQHGVLSSELTSEREKVSKLKQELDTCKDSLEAMHATLGSCQHREKMLKHEITKLEDKQRETEKELAETKTEIEVSFKESSQSLDSVRQALTAKAEKDLAELQQNMNQLLDDERVAKRQQEEAHKDQLARLTEVHESEMKQLQGNNEKDLEKNKEHFEAEIGRIQAEYDEVRADMENKAEEEKTALMEKGKGMIKGIKDRLEKEKQDLSDDVAYLTEKLLREEDDKQRLGIQFQTKIVEYKKKLQAATGRITVLSSDLSLIHI